MQNTQPTCSRHLLTRSLPYSSLHLGSPSLFAFSLHRASVLNARKSISHSLPLPFSLLPLRSHIKNLVGCASLCVFFLSLLLSPWVMLLPAPQHRNNFLTLHTVVLSTTPLPPSFFVHFILLTPWPRNTVWAVVLCFG
ncbi:MAG: hypothetical protein BYD32DRAFT_65881 [Podila humilis]|nr:MAG: hypothetical protein BYD32DRAFT_65881 [Podila humilis]